MKKEQQPLIPITDKPSMKTQIENPNGLHGRYYIEKIVTVPNPDYDPGSILNLQEPYITTIKPVDKDAEYFVLRLDTGGSDINHIKAGRIGIHAYADAIEAHIPQLAKELRERYPLL